MKSYLAQFAARSIMAELISVAELAHPLENGTHFPLFLLCLQQAAKLRDRDWLADVFQQSTVNMQRMLPGRPHPTPACLSDAWMNGPCTCCPCVELGPALKLPDVATVSRHACIVCVQCQTVHLYVEVGTVSLGKLPSLRGVSCTGYQGVHQSRRPDLLL